jgi:hypothetical protein
MMRELGITANTAYGAEAANSTHNGISDSIKARAPTKIADEDASVATIRNAHRAELSDAQRNTISGDTATTPFQRMREFADGVSEKTGRDEGTVRATWRRSFFDQESEEASRSVSVAMSAGCGARESSALAQRDDKAEYRSCCAPKIKRFNSEI